MKQPAALADFLADRNACEEAVKWAKPYGRAYAKAWRECERGDWMLWIAAKLLDRKIVVLAACAIARQSLKYVPEGEQRPLKAIETAECWCRGKATLQQVRDAADAAYAAYAYADAAAAYAYVDAAYAAAAYAYADAAYAYADAAAAYAYADAAYAADAAAAAAYADAAYADVDAAAAAAAAAARKASLKDSARIVRRLIPYRLLIERLREEGAQP